MKILMVGGTGATGILLVKQLLEKGNEVKAIVRSASKLQALASQFQNLAVIEASILDLSDEKLRDLVSDCDAIASCLGHNLTFKGIFGKPRRLVRDATIKLIAAARAAGKKEKVKYVLMNTTGNRNRDLDEPISLAQRMVIALLRVILPPHPDNEQAAEYLRVKIGQTDKKVSWCAVRPDGLIDEEKVSEYELHPSPTRSAIFNAGKVSRINVADFMARLITNEKLWDEWKGRMPVIYSCT